MAKNQQIGTLHRILLVLTGIYGDSIILYIIFANKSNLYCSSFSACSDDFVQIKGVFTAEAVAAGLKSRNVSLKDTRVNKYATRRYYHCSNMKLYKCPYQMSVTSFGPERNYMYEKSSHDHTVQASNFCLPVNVSELVKKGVAAGLKQGQIGKVRIILE